MNRSLFFVSLRRVKCLTLFPFLLPTSSALNKKKINENPKPFPFFSLSFFSSFRLDFIQSLIEFTDGVPFDTAPLREEYGPRNERSVA